MVPYTAACIGSFLSNIVCVKIHNAKFLDNFRCLLLKTKVRNLYSVLLSIYFTVTDVADLCFSINNSL